jgi:hypothetical protein
MNLKNIGIVIAMLFISFSVAFAGWERTYGGPYFDCASSVIQTKDSNYVFAGSSSSEFDYTSIMYYAKLDIAGNVIFERNLFINYGEPGPYCGAGGVMQTDDGNFLAPFSTTTIIGVSFVSRFGLLKFDNDGDTIWSKIYELFDDINANQPSGRLIKADNGKYILPIYSSRAGYDSIACSVICVDSLGNVIWISPYERSKDIGLSNAVRNSNGEFVFVGEDNYNENSFVVAYTAEGETTWSHTYSEYSQVIFKNITNSMDDNSYFICGGIITNPEHTMGDGIVMKIDSLGNVLWEKQYDFQRFDLIVAIKQTFDSGLVFITNTHTLFLDSSYILLTKTDYEGNVLWTRSFGADSYEYAGSLELTYDSGFLICGYTNSYSGDARGDVYIIKTDSLGNSSSISEFVSQKPEIIVSSYPNPFNSYCKIIAPSNSLIQIYDLGGKCIFRKQLNTPQENSLKNNSNNSCIWQPDKCIPSGVYVVTASLETETVGRKILFIK